MHAYLSDPQLKTRFLTEIRKHQEADQIVKSTDAREENGKWRGGAVACSIRSLNILFGTNHDTNDHLVYEKALGVPEWLAWLEDTIFEELPDDQSVEWPLRFAQAVPVGADLEPVKWHFCAPLMSRNIERVLPLDLPDDVKEHVVNAIRTVLSLHEAAMSTGQSDEAAWKAAKKAAGKAAELVAWSECAAAQSAMSTPMSTWPTESAGSWALAKCAARSAQSAAWSGAGSAWSAAEAVAAGDGPFTAYADTLIELLQEAK